MPAAAGGALVRRAPAPQEDQGRVAVRRRPAPRGATARRAWPAPPARSDRRDLGTVRELGSPVPLDVNPSVDALRATFGNAIGRALDSCGDTIVYVAREQLLAVMAWLRGTPEQAYDHPVDGSVAPSGSARPSPPTPKHITPWRSSRLPRRMTSSPPT